MFIFFVMKIENYLCDPITSEVFVHGDPCCTTGVHHQDQGARHRPHFEDFAALFQNGHLNI